MSESCWYGLLLTSGYSTDVCPLINSHAISAIQAKKVRKDLLGTMEAGIQQTTPSASHCCWMAGYLLIGDALAMCCRILTIHTLNHPSCSLAWREVTDWSKKSACCHKCFSLYLHEPASSQYLGYTRLANFDNATKRPAAMLGIDDSIFPLHLLGWFNMILIVVRRSRNMMTQGSFFS